MKQTSNIFTYVKSTPILLCALLLFLSGCTHTGSSYSGDISKDNWKYDFVHYSDSLPDDHPESAENILAIDDEVRADILMRFGHLNNEEAVYALANWVINDYGLGLEYNVDANLTPIEAYQQRLGNCLSYSLLLTQLAKPLGIEIQVNSVDIPDAWNIEDNVLFFYRHVNAVYKESSGEKHVFDFTPGAYDERYPQKTLNQQEALALFYNNKALDNYRQTDYDRAIHFIKLAASLNPDNPDIWTNAGAILKRKESLVQAKDALQFALRIDSEHIVAASQLERLYREENDFENADKYLILATTARTNNPYYLFQTAKQRFLKHNYLQAEELVKKAIKKHRYDSRFFALRGVIENKLGNFKAAQRSFKKASTLELDLEQKQRYHSKAALLGKLTKSSRKQNHSIQYQLDTESL